MNIEKLKLRNMLLIVGAVISLVAGKLLEVRLLAAGMLLEARIVAVLASVVLYSIGVIYMYSGRGRMHTLAAGLFGPPVVLASAALLALFYGPLLWM